MDRFGINKLRSGTQDPETQLPQSQRRSQRPTKLVQAQIDATYETESQFDEDSSGTDRTPIVLGVIAFAIAACLHWMPADSLTHQSFNSASSSSQSIVDQLRT